LDGSIGGTGGAPAFFLLVMDTAGLLLGPIELATELTLLALIFLCLINTGELALLLLAVVLVVLAVPVLFVLATLDLLGLVIVGLVVDAPTPEGAVRKLVSVLSVRPLTVEIGLLAPAPAPAVDVDPVLELVLILLVVDTDKLDVGLECAW
jgi:hypothetical protein